MRLWQRLEQLQQQRRRFWRCFRSDTLNKRDTPNGGAYNTWGHLLVNGLNEE